MWCHGQESGPAIPDPASRLGGRGFIISSVSSSVKLGTKTTSLIRWFVAPHWTAIYKGDHLHQSWRAVSTLQVFDIIFIVFIILYIIP